MRAAILKAPADVSSRPLRITEIDVPKVTEGTVLLRVQACGVCRTDLHITEGELPQRLDNTILGHQIVGEVVQGQCADIPQGSRVGVSWVGGTDGNCYFCRNGLENLCDSAAFTGYTVNGGFAEFTIARSDFVFPIPTALESTQAAPLLCAGIIGFRSLRIADVQHGEKVGLFGFGASAHLALPVLRSWDCQVYVSTRGPKRQHLAERLGAVWVGDELSRPPVLLDRAVTFAPSGDVVVAALSCLRKGGILAVNAIHLDRIPEFDYDRLLWGERQIRSVTNMTRADAHDFLRVASDIQLRPTATVFPLEEVNTALLAIKNNTVEGAAVIVP